MKLLVDLEGPVFWDVLEQLPAAIGDALVQPSLAILCAPRVLDERHHDKRERALWLIREFSRVAAPDVAPRLQAVFINALEYDRVRHLALDTLEALWLRGLIAPDEFRRLVNVSPDPLTPATRTRWLRVMSEASGAWGVDALRRAYLADQRADLIAALAESRDTEAAIAALEDLCSSPRTETERAALQAAIEANIARAAKRAAITGDAPLTTEQVQALANANEFAVLHKALVSGLITITEVASLRQIPATELVGPETLLATSPRTHPRSHPRWR